MTTLNIRAKGGYWLVEDDLEQPWGSSGCTTRRCSPSPEVLLRRGWAGERT